MRRDSSSPETDAESPDEQPTSQTTDTGAQEVDETSTPGQEGDDGVKRKELKRTLHLHDLPSAQKIYDAIPPEGIDVQTLTSKFAQINETNVQYFHNLVIALTDSEERVWVTRRPSLPPPLELKDILNKAKKPESPLEAEKDVEKVVVSKHVSDMILTFSNATEGIRGASKALPEHLFRVFYEDSATLSSYVSLDTHKKHRQATELKLHPENAFQAMVDFDPEHDLSRPRVERHLTWNKKVDPSSYISTYSNFNLTHERCAFRYNKSKLIGERTSVAVISTAGLIAATGRVRIKETTISYNLVKVGRKIEKVEGKHTTQVRDVKIPIWIRNIGLPEDRSSMTREQLEKALENPNCDMWMSVTELQRVESFRVVGSPAHDFEWLACGKIPKAHVIKVMPYDGGKIHQRRGTEIVWSKGSNMDWLWDWNLSVWREALAHEKLLRPRRKHEEFKKNKGIEPEGRKRQRPAYDALEPVDNSRRKLNDGQPRSSLETDSEPEDHIQGTQCPSCGTLVKTQCSEDCHRMQTRLSLENERYKKRIIDLQAQIDALRPTATLPTPDTDEGSTFPVGEDSESLAEGTDDEV